MSRNFIPTINISSLLDCRFDSKNSLKMIKKIEKACKEVGFFQIIGHGIGKKFHEAPQILHYGKRNTGVRLEEGMIFTIEPMINVGSYKTKLLSDGWTVVTQDHELSAQYEHTVLVTNNGSEILTLRTEEDDSEFK